MTRMDREAEPKISGDTPRRLFPTDLPESEWLEFSASGFSQPVAGMVFRTTHGTCCGVALGGLGTGCLDIETSGVLGFSTLFPAPRHPHEPYQDFYRNPQLYLPFLGIAVEGKTWVLATRKFIEGGAIEGCTDPGMCGGLKEDAEWVATWRVNVPKINGVEPVEEIHYWGHYPVADLEYDISAPLAIGLRAWAPFVPGDLGASNIPGAVFEVHLRNTSGVCQRGTLAFSFPGPINTDPACGEGARSLYVGQSAGEFHGVTISALQGEMGYALGVSGPERVRFGGGLASHPDAWSKIASELPSPQGKEAGGGTVCSDLSASLAVDFELHPGDEKTLRIILAWYARHWQGGSYKELVRAFERALPEGSMTNSWDIPGRDSEEGEQYTAMYAVRYDSALDVAHRLSQDHASLLQGVLAWQQAIYSSSGLPLWLRDCLVNNLNLIPECSYWAQPRKPLKDWSFPTGAFGLIESPRGCDIMGCIVSNWYGDLPILYFFPQLESMILRNYYEYMRQDGAVPFLYPNGDWTKPTYEWLLPLNGDCFVDLVDRLWLRTGDDDVLREFYAAVKKSTIFTMTLKAGPQGIVSVPREGTGQEWWEHTPVRGMVTHMAGMRLSTLAIAQRMAKKMGDQEFACQCQDWLDQASRVVEDNLWDGETYLFWKDPETNEQCDDILCSQLDGDWASLSHGLPGVFRQDRVEKVLDTVSRSCLVDYGLVGFATRSGEPLLNAYGSFTTGNIITAMVYMYYGQRELGLEIVRRHVDNVVRRQRHPWDLPNMIRCDTGERHFGTDYFQNMILWGLPAALEGKDIAAPCAPGGLVDRVLRAGQLGE